MRFIYSVKIVFFIFLTVFSLLTMDWSFLVAQGRNASDGPWREVNLTEGERAFLMDNPVMRLGVGVKFPPFQYVDRKDGNPVFKGMVSSYLKLLEGRLGVELKPVYGISFKTALEMGRNKEIDLFPCIARTPERAEYLIFSNTYLSYPLVVITPR